MRVLIAIRPFHGHLHPSVPLARSLCAAGHDVAFATERGFCQVVERCGFAARPAGVDPFAPSPPHAESYEFSDVVTRQKVDDILRIATNWPFDLIVRDPTDFAGVIAAETLGVPQATLGFTRFCHPDWWLQILGSSLDVVRASLGLPLDPELRRLHPSLYIDTVPPWLQVTEGLPTDVLYQVRPQPYEAPPRAGPIGLGRLPDGPIVLVTLGTVYNRRPELLERLCRGAVRAGAHVICTLGPRQDGQAASLAHLPNTQVHDYVPISDLLPHCALVIAHGGYNTVVATLLQGVPLLLVPLGSDNAYNAKRCVELGAAVTEEAHNLTDDRVEELVSTLLHRPQYRQSAARLAAQTAQLPSAASAVPMLEQLRRAWSTKTYPPAPVAQEIET